MFKKKKKQDQEKELFKFNKVEYRDIIAPSCVKEIAPGDMSIDGKADTYWVEVGDVSGAVKYCRSFYANITGNATHAE
ncbi:MAG: hypothetical protein WAO30_08205, partial [Thermacetogeniaceae bacterium]